MSCSRLLSLFIAVVFIFSAQCTRKSDAGKKAMIIIGTDTVTSAVAAELDPADGSDSARLVHSAMRLLLGAVKTGSSDTLSVLFKDRLLLVSGTEWTARGAAILLDASEALASTPVASGECDRIDRLADSLTKIIQDAPKQGFSFKADSAMSICDESLDIRSRQKKALAMLLGINDETAQLCHDFVFKKAVVPQISDDLQSKKMVSGLLNENRTVTEKEHVPAGARVRSGVKEARRIESAGSVSALAFRKEQSIRDTITRHIPSLRQLYKKGLKTDATMEGRVVVSFSVTPEGTVASAVVKTSAIASVSFQKSLCAYLRQVRFQPVPEKAGMMLFDFPFDFNPEM